MNPETRKPSRLLAYLQLFRLPNVFTAMADVAMGFWFTHAAVSGVDWVVFALLLVASSCLYTAGMVLNDVYDLEIDRRERPSRPLPSGRIDAVLARRIGNGLLIAGLAFAFLAAVANIPQTRSYFSAERPFICAMALAGLVQLYNSSLKHTALGPLAMGGCRVLNVLLGMSASPEPWTMIHWIVAGGLGVYIAGVTWFARTEATTSNRRQLMGALITISAGLAVLWLWPYFGTLWETVSPKFSSQKWDLLWCAVGAIIAWRFLRAIARPSPINVQAAIKAGILGVIMLDAVTVFAARGPVPAIAIFLLIIPTLALGAWVYST